MSSGSKRSLALLADSDQKRPTPGNGYLECLTNEEKCEVNFSPIKEITENAILTADGKSHHIDVLVCATGFDVSFKPRFVVAGRNGLKLGEAWKDRPSTYLSATAPGFPNYFSELTKDPDSQCGLQTEP